MVAARAASCFLRSPLTAQVAPQYSISSEVGRSVCLSRRWQTLQRDMRSRTRSRCALYLPVSAMFKV